MTRESVDVEALHAIAHEHGNELVCSCGAVLSNYGLTQSLHVIWGDHLRRERGRPDALAAATARAEAAEAREAALRAGMEAIKTRPSHGSRCTWYAVAGEPRKCDCWKADLTALPATGGAE